MTFDPFGDYETEGYLRNFEKVKDLDIVKRLEHASLTTGIDEAFAQLAKPKQLGYEHLLQTHKILFDAARSAPASASIGLRQARMNILMR